MSAQTQLILGGIIRRAGAVITGTAFIMSLVQPVFVFAATSTTIFSDGFESGDFSNWTSPLHPNWTVIGGTLVHSGDKKARVNGPIIPLAPTSSLTKTISTIGYTNITFSYWYNIDVDRKLENDDHVLVKVWDQGSSFTTLADYTDTSTNDWTFATFTLPMAYDDQQSVTIFFSPSMNASTSDRFELDDVLITGETLEEEQEEEEELVCQAENFATAFASEVKEHTQGKRKDNSNVLQERSDPSKALGTPQSAGAPFDNPVPNGEFYSLGFDGAISFGFGSAVVNGPGDDIFVYEITGGTSYPPESVEVFAKQTDKDWVLLGTLTRDGSLDLGSLAWADFIRLNDTSDIELFEPTADGYDLDALQAQVCLNDSEEEKEEPQENQAPIITLNGDATITLAFGDTFTDPGATAHDPEDGDISNNIQVGGDTVDTSTPGTYIITYDVQDSQGASATQATRAIIVEQQQNNNDNGGNGPQTTQCSDGIDNDGDQLVDINDPGCADQNDNDETDEQTTNNGGGGGGDNGGPSTTIIVSGGGGGGGSGGSDGGETFDILSTILPQGEVLGASLACEPYLGSFIKPGGPNNSEDVIKLQQLLNEMGDVELPITGLYGPLTIEAVKNFQLKYGEDILAPWIPFGLPNAQTPTGYVYKTTQWKIN